MKAKLLLTIALAAACSKSEAPPAGGTPAGHVETATPPAKDPQKAKQMIASGAVVLDVRTPEEFSGGHLPQAQNMPVQTFGDHLAEVDKLTGGDKTKPIVTYCEKGGRAAKAKQQLEAAGYTNVVNGGGYNDLK